MPIRLILVGRTILQTVRSTKFSESIAMKPGLNRRENRLRSRGALQRLEPDEGKLSRPVLRGGGGGNTAPLPDPTTNKTAQPLPVQPQGCFAVVNPRPGP